DGKILANSRKRNVGILVKSRMDGYTKGAHHEKEILENITSSTMKIFHIEAG
ncbi:5689_t:CDS:2, partial [Scutellospora calospora]